MSLVTGSCSLLFWFNALLSVCLLHIAQRSLWVCARVFTPRCVCTVSVCSCTGACVRLFVCAYCMCAYLLSLCGGFGACVCAHAVYLKTWKSSSQRIKRHSSSVQFKASNLQMCAKGYGFYILYQNNADIPFSCAYLASLVQSLYNLVLADGAFTWE